MTERKFNINFKGNNIAGEVVGIENEKDLLLLHGAASEGRERVDILLEKLKDLGFRVVAFDFIGHGESEGDMNDTSLRSRVEQSQTIFEELDLSKPLSLVAASMSGHVAAKLTEIFDVESLVLIVPAVYATEAYDAKFGDDFSEIIRAPESWKDSDVWGILRDFRGKVMVVAAEEDDVIPQGVIDKLYDAAEGSEKRVLYSVPDSDHHIMKFFSENPEKFDKFISRLRDFL